jgi:hypothetical protein
MNPTIIAAALLVLLAACGATPPTSSQPLKPEYTIRADDPPVGSRIKRVEVSGSALPINKRYHELTPAEKTILHGYYESIATGDEPPFPAEGLRPIHDAIRRAQAKLLVRGELLLIVEVSSTGLPTEVKAIGAPSPEMVQFAASVLLLTKFKPAVCGGTPCKMQFPFRYSFSVAIE